jgi:hypothetical protein
LEQGGEREAADTDGGVQQHRQRVDADQVTQSDAGNREPCEQHGGDPSACRLCVCGGACPGGSAML